MPMLPFLSLGVLKAQNGNTLASNIPVTIWPSNGSVTSYGEAFDHQAEASLDFVNELVNGPSNRKLVVDGVTYMLMQATPHAFLPHVELVLRRVKAGGP